MRIHLLCDHKWRDLPNLSALQLSLRKLGYRTLLSGTKDAHAMITYFRPNCVVLNHLFSDSHRRLAKKLRAAGIAVVILPTEGAMRPEFSDLGEGEFTDFNLADLILAWSDTAAEGIRNRWAFDDARVPVAGCNRLDFYDSRFYSVIESRTQFCSRHGLDPMRPIVTWATQYGYADIGNDNRSSMYQQWLTETTDVGVKTCYERKGIDIKDIPIGHAKGRDASSHAFFNLAGAMPNVQFLLKPHPIEGINFYREQIAKANLKNVVFCKGEYIWDVLNVSDIELHRHCTTAIEGWLWNKPTIEMGMDSFSVLEWKDREDGSDIAYNTDDLIGLVNGYIDGKVVDAGVLEYRRKYVNRWFGPADGRRCSETAILIDRYLKQSRLQNNSRARAPRLDSSFRSIYGAVLRRWLNRYPDEPIIRRKRTRNIDFGVDKLIRNADVQSYAKKLSKVFS